MNKKKEVAKNTIIIFLGKISTQFLSFLLLPLYTAKLSSADYGLVDLIITYVSLFVPIITLQQEMATFRFLVDSRNDYSEQKKIISTSLDTIFRTMIVFLLLIVIIIPFIGIKYKFWILINIIVVIFSNLFLQISRGFGDNKKFSIASFIIGLISIVSNLILILLFNFGASAILISSCVGNLVGTVYLFVSMKLYKFISFKSVSSTLRKKLIKYSIPLIPNGISWWVVNVSDRTIISIFLGIASNGIYTVSCKFPNIINGFFSIFGLSWTESASLHINDEDRDEFFSDIFNNTIRIFSCLCLLLIAIMPFLFPIMVNQNYSQSYIYIPILIISTFFGCLVSVYSGIYIAKKMTKQVAYTSMISAIINVVSHLLLIKFIGLYAAAISTLLSYLLMSVYRAFDVQKYVKIRYDKKIITLSFVLMIMALFFYYRNSLTLKIFNMIIISAFSIFMNINLLKAILKTIYKKVFKRV